MAWTVGCVLWLAACSGGSADSSEPDPAGPAATVAIDDSAATAPQDASADTPDDADRSVVHPDVQTRADGFDGDGVLPEGVGTVTARVTAANGDVCDVCLWLASEPAQRSAGLMGVTDLGDAVGMAFVWPAPTSGNFFMFQTPTPLSIAWFEPDGRFLASADMDPCVGDDSSVCERFGPGDDYDLAIEMFDGQLGLIGIGPGSTIELLAGTESPTCLIS